MCHIWFCQVALDWLLGLVVAWCVIAIQTATGTSPVPMGTGITGQQLILNTPGVLTPFGLSAGREVGRYLNNSLSGLQGSCFTHLDDDHHLGVFPHKLLPFISSDSQGLFPWSYFIHTLGNLFRAPL